MNKVSNLHFSVGSIVTGYHKGYWKVTQIERRFWTDKDEKYNSSRVAGEEYNPLVHYKKVLNENFTAAKKSYKKCDAGYCKLVTRDIIAEMRKAYNDGLDRLENLL